MNDDYSELKLKKRSKRTEKIVVEEVNEEKQMNRIKEK